MRQYEIAGHIVQISGEGLDSLPGFDFFTGSNKRNSHPIHSCHPALDAGSPEKVVLTIKGLPVEPAIFCELPPVFTSEYEETSYELFAKEAAWLIRMKKQDGANLLAEVSRMNSSFQSTVYTTGSFSNNSLRYLCWLIFGIAALSRQTVSIHSSVVVHQGKSIFFLGESGTGKSTHTRLWLNHIQESELLNDDSPFIRIEEDGSIRAYGSPWSGKTPCYKNISTPVAAFVRLSQAPVNRIRRLTGVEAIAALLPSCPFAFAYENQLSEQVYSIISLILQQLPVYHLECLPDANAAQLVYSTLFNS